MKRLTFRNDIGLPTVRWTPNDVVVGRLCAIEDILGDDYDLDRLRELVTAYNEGRYIIMKDAEREGVSRLVELAEADRAGRCIIAPVKPGEVAWCGFVYHDRLSGGTRNVSYPVILRGWQTTVMGAEYESRCFRFGELYESKEAAEAALKGEQNG